MKCRTKRRISRGHFYNTQWWNAHHSSLRQLVFCFRESTTEQSVLARKIGYNFKSKTSILVDKCVDDIPLGDRRSPQNRNDKRVSFITINFQCETPLDSWYLYDFVLIRKSRKKINVNLLPEHPNTRFFHSKCRKRF